MKKNLLFIGLCAISLTSFSQTIHSNNFDGLNLGDFASDITGVIPGKGGFSIFATNGTSPTTTNNAAANNFQVVAAGNNGTQGARITSPNGNKGSRFLFKKMGTEWAARTAGNDILEVEFSLFTGTVAAGRAPLRAVFVGTDGGTTLETIAALQYNPQTQELIGLGRFNNGGNIGTYTVNLGPMNTDLILNANTWYKMGYSYNSITGQIIWKTSFNNTSATVNDPSLVITGMSPEEIDFLSFGTQAEVGPPAVPANATTIDYFIDDYSAKATASDTLLSIDDLEIEANAISLFPNPANDIITLKTKVILKEFTVFNNLGQIVLQKNSEFSETNELNISHLKSGLYIMNITSKDGATQAEWFIKN